MSCIKTCRLQCGLKLSQLASDLCAGDAGWGTDMNSWMLAATARTPIGSYALHMTGPCSEVLYTRTHLYSIGCLILTALSDNPSLLLSQFRKRREVPGKVDPNIETSPLTTKPWNRAEVRDG